MTMTYNSLVAQVLKYTIRQTDPEMIDQMPNFIYQAEQRICRESKSVGLETYVTGTLTTSQSVLAKPARWRRSISFNFGTGEDFNTRNQLYLRSYEFLRLYWPDSTKLEPPKFYSDYGYDHLLIAPTPDQDYPFEFAFLQLPEPLSINVQTNWLTNNAPDVLLYATLVEAYTFLQNESKIAVWESLFQRGIGSLNAQDDMRTEDRASNRASD